MWGLLALPLRPVQATWRLVTFLVTGGQKRSHTLAVAGLDESKAQPMLYALRRSASTPEARQVADDWVSALALSQLASARLLAELDAVEASLQFWTTRKRRGRHFAFALLQNGPVSFTSRLAELLRLRQRGRRAPSHADLTERRVLVFRLLRSALCQALAQVHAAAALLYLQQTPRPPTQQQALEQAAAADDADGDADSDVRAQAVLHAAARAAVDACLAQVAAAFEQLQAAADEVLGPQAGEGEDEGPGGGDAEEARVLRRTLSNLLGLHRLRRALNMEQQQQQQQPATGAAAPGAQAGAAQTAAAGQQSRQLQAAQAAVGWSSLQTADASAAAALASSQHAAARLRDVRLLRVPRWARMPSALQRRWLQLVVASVAAGYCGRWLYAHSALSGSDDLARWTGQAAAAVRSAWHERILAPLEQVADDLFNTFRRRPTIVGYEDYQREKESLRRMLADFERDFAGRAPPPALPAATAPSHSTGAGTGAGAGGSSAGAVANGSDVDLQRGMELVMQCYERELKRPLRNLVAGQLVRSLLVQVQKLKLDGASSMLEMDQILKANELSISLVAAIPAIAVAGAGVYYLGRWVTPTPPDPRWEALPLRLAMTEVERALSHLAAVEEEQQQQQQRQQASAIGGAGAGPGAAALAAPVPLAPAALAEQAPLGEAEAAGLLAWRLAGAEAEARELFRRHRGLLELSRRSEWPSLRADLLELASPGPLAHKLRTAQRMTRTYRVFHQF